MSTLTLCLFGPPRLERDGKSIEVSRRKVLALLAYLAVTGQPHSRDTLATLFWPEADQSEARANLRRTLSALKKTLAGGEWLNADRELIGLNHKADLWVDVAAFQTCLAAYRAHGHAEDDVCPACLKPLTQAVSLYSDDFMAGFSLRDSPDFDEWQFFQAENLRQELSRALERLIRVRCDQGDHQPALAYARRWLKLDPLREEAHRRLMQLYAWTDQRPAALRQYQECARILAEELGASPSPETTALYQDIQTGEVGRSELPSPRAEVPPQPPAPSLPPFLVETDQPPPLGATFVGREQELANLDACLQAALTGDGRVIFVTGEAGSGKTALVREFARRSQAAAPELVVALGNCNAHTGLGDPYLPFREILALLTGDLETRWAQGVITTENAQRLWALLPAALQTLVDSAPDLIDSFIPVGLLTAYAAVLGPQQPAWTERLTQAQQRRRLDNLALAPSDLFEQYTNLLKTLATDHPLLLIIDDAQWADAASTNLLFHLGRRLAGARILLLVTYRPDEVAVGRPVLNSGQAERHPLEPVINELKRTYGEVGIDLEPTLGRRFVDALLDAEPNLLGEPFRVALYRQTLGHPLFTVELLHNLQESGSLRRDQHGRWVEASALNWQALPVRVEAVIEERIGRLDTNLRDLLAVASVEGETFTAQVVARVQGVGERALLGTLSRDLEKRHHLVQAQGEVRVNQHFLSRYRFTHTMFQQYLYNTFGPGERRLLHGEIALALKDLYPGENEDLTVQLARHYAEAGQVEQAVDYLLRAGDRAREVYAYQEAINFYEQALALLKQANAHERAARTLMKLGLTYHLAFNFQRAREAYQEGFTLWQHVGVSEEVKSPPSAHPLRLIWYDPPTLDPSLTGDDTSGHLISQLFSGLVTFNADLDVVPEIAQSWDVLDGGCKYIFYLRHDAHWSDGQPITAHDFVYAWRRMLTPAIKSPMAGLLFDIKGALAYYQGEADRPDQVGVSAPDDFTLIVELENPRAYFPQLLTLLYPLPRHVIAKHGSRWTDMAYMVTNGPFKLTRWQPGESIELTRNPAYRGYFAGNVQHVMLSLNKSPDEQLAMYEAGQLDVVSLSSPLPQTQGVRQRHAAEYFTGPGLHTSYVGINVNQPPFNDVRVRQALAMAIDKETLVSVNGRGYSFPATGGFVPPEMPGHSPGIGLPYDPERARRLLAEAGYPGGQGIPALHGLAKDSASKTSICNDLAVQWHEILGITINWRDLPWPELLQLLDHNPPALFLMGWRADYPDPDNPLRLGTNRHWIGWTNETYDNLVEEARRCCTNLARRLELYQQADRILMDEAAIVPIFYGRTHLLVRPWVHAFSVSTMARYQWKNIIIEPHPS